MSSKVRRDHEHLACPLACTKQPSPYSVVCIPQPSSSIHCTEPNSTRGFRVPPTRRYHVRPAWTTPVNAGSHLQPPLLFEYPISIGHRRKQRAYIEIDGRAPAKCLPPTPEIRVVVRVRLRHDRKVPVILWVTQMSSILCRHC